MLQLPNCCTCSDPAIYPKDWNRAGASLKKSWYIQYYFHDPNFKDRFPHGKYFIIKGGINKLKTLPARREAIKMLYDEIIRSLTVDGYNPIIGKMILPAKTESNISQSMPFIEALSKVMETIHVGKYSKRDLNDIIHVIEKSAIKLRFNNLPISIITRKHIKLILNDCCDTPNKFNKYRSYLMILFNELFEIEATEQDPISRIKKQKTIKKMRVTLTRDERKKINEHLYQKKYFLWRFMLIFFHSGSRESEMMSLKYEDVDLKNQRFKIVVRKGNNYREEWRTIKNIILPLWKEVLSDAKLGQYLFAKFLKPGSMPIDSVRASKYWLKYVKADPPKGLGIKADFYSLKHSNLDEIAELLSIKDASLAAGHTSTVITLNHYLVNEKEREHERLKEVKNKFA